MKNIMLILKKQKMKGQEVFVIYQKLQKLFNEGIGEMLTAKGTYGVFFENKKITMS